MNHSVLKENKFGRMFAIELGDAFDDARAMAQSELAEWGNQIDRISDLFLRMTTLQAEIASTVHFVAVEMEKNGNGHPSEVEILDAVKRWKQRRNPPLDYDEVAQTIRGLTLLGWINAAPSKGLSGKSKLMLEA